MKNIQLLIIFESIFLLVCVTPEPVISEGGWKSLEKQQNRDLSPLVSCDDALSGLLAIQAEAGELTCLARSERQFFRILQSYFTGRGMNLGLGKKEKLQRGYGSKIGSYADKFNNNLDTKDIFNG